MRIFYLVSIGCLLFVVACSRTRKPSDANFTKAINEYLETHGEACTAIGRQFPINIPAREQRDQYGIGPQMAALEQAGLVHSTDTTAVVHGMLDAVRGSTPPQPVKRYELTDDGKKYFQQIPGLLGQSSGFCYGQKSIDSIIHWTQPQTGSSQAEVTYTYKIANLAGWAERTDVQHAFPDIRTTVTGQSRSTQVAGLQLTSKGWEVLGQ